jgi:hypothetical protein
MEKVFTIQTSKRRFRKLNIPTKYSFSIKSEKESMTRRKHQSNNGREIELFLPSNGEYSVLYLYPQSKFHTDMEEDDVHHG